MNQRRVLGRNAAGLLLRRSIRDHLHLTLIGAENGRKSPRALGRGREASDSGVLGGGGLNISQYLYNVGSDRVKLYNSYNNGGLACV